MRIQDSQEMKLLLASVDNTPLACPERFLGKVVTLRSYLVAGYLVEGPQPDGPPWPFDDPPLCVARGIQKKPVGPAFQFVIDSSLNLIGRLLASGMLRITGIHAPFRDNAHGVVRATLAPGDKVYPYRLQAPTVVVALDEDSGTYVSLL